MKSCSLFLLLLLPLLSCAHSNKPETIRIRFLDEHGQEFKQLPLNHSAKSQSEHRAYLEAVKEKKYTIQIVNDSNKRLGLVIAVDGRNIISGQKSDLKPTERMYILGPYERNNYEGWRTDQNTVHRFFFTDSNESYAATFDDHSAMGVIAVAIYEEIPRQILREKKLNKGRSAEPSARFESDSMEAESQAGTGFGEELFSHARLVHFKPKGNAMEKYFYKYEWRQSLCKKGILDCAQANRFWLEQFGYVPFPEDYLR